MNGATAWPVTCNCALHVRQVALQLREFVSDDIMHSQSFPTRLLRRAELP